MEFPIAELMDEDVCTLWLARSLHLQGLVCPSRGDAKRRLFCAQERFPAYRCRACEGYDTLLTGTVFEKTQRHLVTFVLVRRGIATGEPTARVARELGLSRKQLHTSGHRIRANLNGTAPTGAMTGTAFEAGELYQSAGEKSTLHRDLTAPPRRRAKKHKGHGTYANDRPPIMGVLSRETGEQRFWVWDRPDRRVCADRIAENVPRQSPVFCTDAWQGSHGSLPAHATVRHGVRELARDAEGDGRREVHHTPVKEPVRRSAPTCVPSAESTNSTSIATSRRVKRCSTPNA